jgi:hypothetical protein
MTKFIVLQFTQFIDFTTTWHNSESNNLGDMPYRNLDVPI